MDLNKVSFNKFISLITETQYYYGYNDYFVQYIFVAVFFVLFIKMKLKNLNLCFVPYLTLLTHTYTSKSLLNFLRGRLYDVLVGPIAVFISAVLDQPTLSNLLNSHLNHHLSIDTRSRSTCIYRWVDDILGQSRFSLQPNLV